MRKIHAALILCLIVTLAFPFSLLVSSLSEFTVNLTAFGAVSGAGSSIVSLELLSYGNSYTDISDSEAHTLFSLFVNQGISEFTMRFPGFSYTSTGATTTQVTNIKRLMGIANQYGLWVNLDLHTWYTTDLQSTTDQSNYLSYARNTIPKFEAEPNLKAWMVLNEPPAATATSSFNAFIRDLVIEAKTLTAKPVSVRFMMGYSPTTGHYASYLDDEVDFLCRNTYWDSRNPTTAVYGTTQAKFTAAVEHAHAIGKELWITEFGKTSDQVNYFKANVAYYKSVGVDRCFAWAAQTEGTESYNIFNGMTPKDAFYELTSSGPAATPTPTASPSPTQSPGQPLPFPLTLPIVAGLGLTGSGFSGLIVVVRSLRPRRIKRRK